MNRKARSQSTRLHARGFSLVELLVVIFIIALIIGLAIPAVGRVRTSARVAATASTMTSIGQAVSTFSTDQKRLPGYFSQTQMGSASNLTRGFSNMQNIMLDLTGAVVAPGSAAAPTGAIRVGPNTNNPDNVWVNPSLVGAGQAGSKNYLSINEKLLVRGTERTGVNEHKELGDLQDPFGMPILAWARNEASTQTIAAEDDFVQVQVTAGQPAARYYWAGNAAYLTAGVGVGTAARNQGEASNLSSSASDAFRRGNLMTLLGSTANPIEIGANMFPSTGRGDIVLHSAGPDQFYMSSRDSKGNAFRVSDQTVGSGKVSELAYRRNFFDESNARRQPSIDQASLYDDIIQSFN